MSDAADGWTRQQRLAGPNRYNDGDYDPVNNPLGWDKDGHVENISRMAKDMGDTGAVAEAAATRAEAAAATSIGWFEETDGAVETVDASTIRVVGVDRTDRYLSRRGLRIEQEGVVAHTSVVAAVYTGGNTVVTLADEVATMSPMRLFYGQDPRNAPQSSSGDAEELALLAVFAF